MRGANKKLFLQTVLSAVVSVSFAAPQRLFPTRELDPIDGGIGPLTPVFGDGLVATRRGLRPIALEGFSEDVDQDGFVDRLIAVDDLPPLLGPRLPFRRRFLDPYLDYYPYPGPPPAFPTFKK